MLPSPGFTDYIQDGTGQQASHLSHQPHQTCPYTMGRTAGTAAGLRDQGQTSQATDEAGASGLFTVQRGQSSLAHSFL